MPVQEFECQIARGQIGRYLNGEALSSEGLRQLGAHVAECSECKAFLDHRKAALQGMLGETAMPPREEVRAVVEVNPSEALIAQIRARFVEEEPTPLASAPIAAKAVKPVLTKPIIYCGILGVVLVGMTYMTRNPSGLLGPRASQIVAASPAAVDAKTLTSARETSKPPPTPTTDNPKGTSANSPNAKSVPTDAPKATTGVAASSTADTTAITTPNPIEPEKKPAGGKPSDSDKPAGVMIAPTKPAKSPLIVNPKSPDQAQADGSDKPADVIAKPSKLAPVPAKARRAASAPAHALAKPRWRRKPFARRPWSLHHLQPGTGAIHVYRS